MQLSRTQAAIILGGLFLVVLIVVVIALNVRASPKASAFSLTVWGTDPQTAFAGVIDAYKKIHGKAAIVYTQIPEGNYDATLLNALAAGTGPDVFMISNRALPKNRDKIIAADPATLGLAQFRNDFPTVAEQDFTFGGQVYGVPLYIDTMALIYNRDLFDQAAIVSPPATWDEFAQDVPKLATIDGSGHIVKSAAAIGGTEKTIDHGTDLLELLMMQNGAKMTSDDLTQATFNSTGGMNNPGSAALNFYLQFANAGSPLYTWDEGQPNSIDAFASGKTAMVFDYQSALAAIKEKSPYLNIGIAPMPQAAGAAERIDYPLYAGLVVSKQSRVPAQAWDFAVFAATQGAAAYQTATGRPPALRSLLAPLLTDPNLGVFAKQALTARSWYEIDDTKIDALMNAAIEEVLSGKATPSAALGEAQAQVSALMAPRTGSL